MDVEEREDEEDTSMVLEGNTTCWQRFERKYVKAFFIRKTADIRGNEDIIELGSVRLPDAPRLVLENGHLGEEEVEALKDVDTDENREDEDDLLGERQRDSLMRPVGGGGRRY